MTKPVYHSEFSTAHKAARRQAWASRSIADAIFALYLLLAFVGALMLFAVVLNGAAAWLSPIISKSVSLLAP